MTLKCRTMGWSSTGIGTWVEAAFTNVRTTQMVKLIHTLLPDRVLSIFEVWSLPLSNLFWTERNKSRSHLKLYYRRQEAKLGGGGGAAFRRPGRAGIGLEEQLPQDQRDEANPSSPVFPSALFRAGTCQGGRLSLKCQDKNHLHPPSV